MPKVVFEKNSSSDDGNLPGNNNSSGNGCWTTVIVACVIVFFLAALGSEHDSVNNSPSTHHSAENDQANHSQPEEVLHYQKTCGDSYVENATWYRVLGDSQELNNLQKNYCGDAFLRNNSTVQVASFTSQQKADEFAELLQRKTESSFWVERYTP